MFSSEDVLESHTFPVFMGTGTVSRRLGDVRFAPSISSSSPRPLVWKPAWFISSCRRRTTQESDLAVNSRPPSLEVSTSFAHSVALSFLSCQKKCQPSDGGRFWQNPPQTTIAYAPPPDQKKKKKVTVLFPSTFPINSVSSFDYLLIQKGRVCGALRIAEYWSSNYRGRKESGASEQNSRGICAFSQCRCQNWSHKQSYWCYESFNSEKHTFR